jgi:metal-responsive CopG/Arc/MetJ family transcriptional regulator
MALKRTGDLRVTIPLPPAIVRALDDMADEADISRIHLVRSLLLAIIKDDAAAHGKKVGAA